MTVRASLVLLAGIFVAALSVQVAERLSTDALNMAVGVVCGMVASIPVSFGLLLAMQRRREAQSVERADAPEDFPPARAGQYGGFANPRAAYPPIIVMAPPQTPYAASYPPYAGARPVLNAGTEAAEERSWKIIGEEEA